MCFSSPECSKIDGGSGCGFASDIIEGTYSELPQTPWQNLGKKPLERNGKKEMIRKRKGGRKKRKRIKG